MAKLFTAAEIAAMNLSDLPSTTRGIQLRAKKEEWHYETKVGLGGVRKMYAIPRAYLPGYQPLPPEIAPVPVEKQEDRSEVAGAIAGGVVIDPRQLATAMRALDEWLDENKLVIDDADRKAEIVVFLCKYLQKGAGQGDLQEVLKLVAR
ncbi:hypothetical protein ACO0K0_07335 [Undibacterium sp. SXout11W]|uniref:hypothetical protein n=1 Tax=Undibacterium sp. SXout11W TaxID=3413050 RepID=UPI003BF197AA